MRKSSSSDNFDWGHEQGRESVRQEEEERNEGKVNKTIQHHHQNQQSLQRSRRFINTPFVTIILFLCTIGGIITWYFIANEKEPGEQNHENLLSTTTKAKGETELEPDRDVLYSSTSTSIVEKEVLQNYKGSEASYSVYNDNNDRISNKYTIFSDSVSGSGSRSNVSSLTSYHHEDSSPAPGEKKEEEDYVGQEDSKDLNHHETFFEKVFMGISNHNHNSNNQKSRFQRVKGISRSLKTKLTSTFGTLQDNSHGIVCFPDTNVEFNLAINGTECCVIYLMRSRDDPPYLVEQETYISSRKVIMGNPALMPLVQPEKGVYRNFRVVNGGILDIRFVTLRGGSAIQVGENTGLALGSSIFQEYGGEIRLQGVLFSSGLQTYEKYVEDLENPPIKRALGGTIFTVGGTPTMVGCTIFGYLPYGDPSLNKVAIGGFGLHLGGITTEIGTVRIGYNLWGNIVVVGGYQAIFQGSYDAWGIFEVGIGPIAAQQGIGLQMYVGTGVLSVVAITRTTSHFMIQRASMGLFHCSAGVFSFVGYEQHLARFMRAFFNIGGKFHNSAGIFNVIGLIQISVHFLSHISSIGGLELNGAGVMIVIGQTRISTEYAAYIATIGGQQYQGGGILIKIGEVRLFSRFLSFGVALGGNAFCLGGLVIQIGLVQFSAAVLAFSRAIGGGIFLLSGLYQMALGFIGGRVVFISGGGPFIRVGFQGAAPNNELTGGEFRAAKTATVWNTGKITTRGRTLSSFSVDKIQEEEKSSLSLTKHYHDMKSSRIMRRIARRKGYPYSYNQRFSEIFSLGEKDRRTLEQLNTETEPSSSSSSSSSSPSSSPSSSSSLSSSLLSSLSSSPSIISFMDSAIIDQDTIRSSEKPSSSFSLPLISTGNSDSESFYRFKNEPFRLSADNSHTSVLDIQSRIQTLSTTSPSPSASLMIYNVTFKSQSTLAPLIEGDIGPSRCSICTESEPNNRNSNSNMQQGGQGNSSSLSLSSIVPDNVCTVESQCQSFNTFLSRSSEKFGIENFINPDIANLFQKYSSILSTTSANRINSRLTRPVDDEFEEAWVSLQSSNSQAPHNKQSLVVEEEGENSSPPYNSNEEIENRNYYIRNFKDHIQEGNITFYFHPDSNQELSPLSSTLIKNALYLYLGTDKGYSLSVAEANQFDEIFTNPTSYDLFRLASENDPSILRPAIPKQYFLDREQPVLDSCLTPSGYEISAYSSSSYSNSNRNVDENLSKLSSPKIGKQTFSFYLTTFDPKLHKVLMKRMQTLIEEDGEDYVAILREIYFAESLNEENSSQEKANSDNIRLYMCHNSKVNLVYEKIMGKRRKTKDSKFSTFTEKIFTKSQKAKVLTEANLLADEDESEQDSIEVEELDVSTYVGLENGSFLSPIIHLASLGDDSILPASTVTMGEIYQVAFLYFPVGSKVQVYLMHEDESFIPVSHEATVVIMPKTETENNNHYKYDEDSKKMEKGDNEDSEERTLVTQMTWMAPMTLNEGSYFFRAIDFGNPGLFTYSTIFEIVKP